MMTPPLCIVQARYHSTRLPGKMLLTLGDETLIARGVRLACEAFDAAHVVVAIPKADEPGPLGDELRRIGATIFAWEGVENDVLGRFHACAHAYRWHPESVIVRYTPDDPFKSVEGLRRVAAGERLPVEIGGEAFTLGTLDEAQRTASSQYHTWVGDTPVVIAKSPNPREHITHALFPTLPPPPPPGVWTIDCQADLDAARERIARETG